MASIAVILARPGRWAGAPPRPAPPRAAAASVSTANHARHVSANFALASSRLAQNPGDGSFPLSRTADMPSLTSGRNGRVEDGCGSLGPMANAPFPIPAHRTGRADLRHPALRLASPQGTRHAANDTG